MIQTVIFTPEDGQPQYFNQALTLYPGANVLGEQGMANLKSIPDFSRMIDAGIIQIEVGKEAKDPSPKK